MGKSDSAFPVDGHWQGGLPSPDYEEEFPARDVLQLPPPGGKDYARQKQMTLRKRKTNT